MIYVKTNNKSTQNWLIVESIDKNGIIKIKNKNIFIKLIRVQPINFNLKTTLEKEAILNSYKILLKTCNFNLQILIHTSKDYILFNFYINSQSLQISGNDWYYYLSN